MRNWSSAFILLILFSAQTALAFKGTREIFENNSAVKSLSEGDSEAAKKEFAKLLAKYPNNPIFKFNLGGVFLLSRM